MSMSINEKISFKSAGFYNITAKVQENTVLNRGLIDLGGCAVPQVIMSNNKDERVERSVIQGLYFITSFVAPFVLLPAFNRFALRNNGIVKNFANNEKRIMEVSKVHLIKSVDAMKQGIIDTAKFIEVEAAKDGKQISVLEDFQNILERNKLDFKKRLINAHANVLTADFLATAWMWSVTPWVGMEVTKFRTKRSGFSATYGMIDETQSKLNAQKHEHEKKKKLLYSALIATIPAVLFSKGIKTGLHAEGKKLNIIQKFAQNFDYNKGMFPSKTIFAAIWLLCDYPAQIISARDKYEKRDRALRGGALFVAFFGGDFVLNNVFGRLSDKYFHTNIMYRPIDKKLSFFKKLVLMPKPFSKLEDLKDVAPKVYKRTKNVGAGLYWLTLFANMAILGFALPLVLNKFLKNSIQKDATPQASPIAGNKAKNLLKNN